MTIEEATEILGVLGSMACTIHFWGTDTPSQKFDTVHGGLNFITEAGKHEPLPDLHIYGNQGDIAVNGPDLEKLIAAAGAIRAVP